MGFGRVLKMDILEISCWIDLKYDLALGNDIGACWSFAAVAKERTHPCIYPEPTIW